jgi:hypothetical protein
MANIRMWMFVSLICNGVAFAAAAQDQDAPVGDSKVYVNDWRWCGPGGAPASTCVRRGQAVPTFRSDGTPATSVDPLQTPIHGLRDLDPDYATVLVSGDPKKSDSVWVSEDLLSITYCDKPAASQTPVPGHAAQKSAMGMGSGAACPQ